MDDLLLSDEKLWVIGCDEEVESDDVCIYCSRAIAKAQLTHCEPLIRAKVAQEILSRIEILKADYSKECGWSYPCKDDHPDESCAQLICTTSCKWWQELKKQYEVMQL